MNNLSISKIYVFFFYYKEYIPLKINFINISYCNLFKFLAIVFLSWTTSLATRSLIKIFQNMDAMLTFYT